MSSTEAASHRLGGSVAIVALVLLCGSVATHAAPVTSTLSFSDATWSDGGGLSGNFTYVYDSATDVVLSVTSIDVTTTAGSTLPGFSYVYSVPSLTDTVGTFVLDTNDAAAESYELFVASPANSHRIWLDWNGLGSAAALVAAQPSEGNAIVETYDPGISRFLTSAGTSQGVDAVVPEPGALSLFGFGATTLWMVRRRRCV
jgi:hypothetical protein